MLFSGKATRPLLSAAVLAAGLLAGHAPTPTPAHAAVIQVQTLADNTTADGDCSLREAINNANANALLHGDCLAGTAAPDIISFSVSGTITLTSTLTITAGGPLTIIGPVGGITLSGGNATRPITINAGASVTLDQLTIANGDTLDGGGISNTGILTLLNSTLRDNTAAGSGGAIQNLGQLFVGNSTFTGNDAPTGNGGAINTAVQLVMSNSTVAGNTTVGSGGGIRVQAGVATVQNTILAGNTAGIGPNCSGALTAGGVNVVQNTTGCTITGGTTTVADPVLDVLADNGGPVFTMALLDGSPALNTGDATVCANATLVNNEDARGVVRPQGPGCDVGAFERRHFIVNSTSDVVDASPGNGVCLTAGAVCTLRAAIQEVNALEGPSTITFSVNGTHTVTLGSLPSVTRPVIVDGTGASVTVNGNGQGLTLGFSGATVLRRLTITGGTLGGVRFIGNHSVTVANSTISGNTTSLSAGGAGIYKDTSAGSVTITDTTISGNTSAVGPGGGVKMFGGSLVLANSTVSGNSASNGGGIYAGGPATVSNSTISGNTSSGDGGGLWTFSTTTVSNSTIAGNQAPGGLGGGAYRSGGVFTVANSILAGNTALTGPECSNGLTGQGVNLRQNSAGCTITGGTLLTGDPLLGPLADNGGLTLTRALAIGSPAINAGDSTICTANPVGGKDQRGVARPPSGNCDLGAYELPNFVVNSLLDTADAAAGNGACATAGGVCTLRAAVQESNALDVVSHTTFSVSGSISTGISSAFPFITSPMTIDGSGQNVTVNQAGFTSVLVFDVPGRAASVTGLTLTGADTSVGGGLAALDGVITISRSIITGNHTSLFGGGVAAAGSSSVTLINTTVSNNTTDGDGGGVYAGESSTLSVVNSTISGNTATDDGGGLFSSAPVTVTNTTVSGNAANGAGSGGGGGILATGNLTVTSSTIAGNTTESLGGGIQRLGGTTTLKNTIVAGNTALLDNNCSGTFTGQGVNLVHGGTGLGCTITGGTLVTGDPLLAPLASNGGPTQTRALLTGSPALNAGDAAICAATPVSNKDQRGLARPQGAGCELGAYEAPQITINDVTQPEGNAGTSNFTFTVSLSAAPLAGSTVTVQRQTANGTATAGSDFTALALAGITFNAGETSKLVTVVVNGDNALEANETFFVNVSGAVNAVITDAQGQGTISNDDVAVPDINVAPVSLSYGSQNVGTTSANQEVIVQNKGTGPLNLGALTLGGANPGDFVKGADTCTSQTVAPAGQCTVKVAFAPTAVGARSAVLVIPSNDPDENPVNAPLSGTGVGVPEINVTPGSVAFSNQTLGTTSATQQVTVQNTGTAALNVGTLTLGGANPGDFVKSADTCSGQSVAPAGQCTLSLAFAPAAVGGRAATLVIPSNDTDENPVNIPLTGTGAPPLVIGGKNLTITTGSIDLSWDGGAAQDSYTLLKYNTSTAVADLIPVAGNATSFSDATATNGVVYCYVLAALNGATFLGLSDLLCGMAGQESGTVTPQNFDLKLGGTANATMTWAAPVGGADSYLLQVIPLDGSPITNLPLGGGATTSTQPVTPAGTCFQLIAFKGAGFGTSDVLCGVPGVSTLVLGSARTSASEALGQVAGRLESLWPAPRD